MQPERPSRFGPRAALFVLLASVSVLVMALLHEFGHWAMGTLLGNEMAMSLNLAPVLGTYHESWHEHAVTAAGPAITMIQAGVFYGLIRTTGNASLMPFLLAAGVHRVMAAGMNMVNPNDEGRLSEWLGLNLYVLPLVVSGGLLWLLVDTSRRLDYGITRGIVEVLVVMHLLGLVILADQFWSIRIL